MSKPEKVVKLFKQTNSYQLLGELMEALEHSEITDMVIVARQKVTDRNREEVMIDLQEGAASFLRHWWFGETTCFTALGLCHYMIDKINRYVNGEEK